MYSHQWFGRLNSKPQSRIASENQNGDTPSCADAILKTYATRNANTNERRLIGGGQANRLPLLCVIWANSPVRIADRSGRFQVCSRIVIPPTTVSWGNSSARRNTPGGTSSN